jgi:hypothetical protein
LGGCEREVVQRWCRGSEVLVGRWWRGGCRGGRCRWGAEVLSRCRGGKVQSDAEVGSGRLWGRGGEEVVKKL